MGDDILTNKKTKSASKKGAHKKSHTNAHTKKSIPHEDVEKEETYTVSKSVFYTIIGVAAIIIVLAIIPSGDPVSLIIINDERCGIDCDITGIVPQLEQILGSVNVEYIDYLDERGQELYATNNVGPLPALLFTEDIQDSSAFPELAQFMEDIGDYLLLRIGAFHDPTLEICDNGIDDTGNGLVDCDDPDCAGAWHCAEKVETPVVELFIMSHCPFGTQMQKGVLPVAYLLQDHVDFQMKFVNYAMRGEIEIREQMRQECVAREFPDQQLDYLKCFLNSTQGLESEALACLNLLNIDEEVISDCEADLDAEFGIWSSFSDQSTWLGGQYPQFPLHDEENIRYGVQGSPTFIINGREPPAGRDSQSILDAICSTFIEKPEECDTVLSSETPGPGFGLGTTTTQNLLECGV
ncbi:MAG: hypothetical protein ACMXYK_04720 [Candidatus Woesearchaeota archaeon]